MKNVGFLRVHIEGHILMVYKTTLLLFGHSFSLILYCGMFLAFQRLKKQ